MIFRLYFFLASTWFSIFRFLRFFSLSLFFALPFETFTPFCFSAITIILLNYLLILVFLFVIFFCCFLSHTQLPLFLSTSLARPLLYHSLDFFQLHLSLHLIPNISTQFTSILVQLFFISFHLLHTQTTRSLSTGEERKRAIDQKKLPKD